MLRKSFVSEFWLNIQFFLPIALYFSDGTHYKKKKRNERLERGLWPKSRIPIFFLGFNKEVLCVW